MNLLRNLLADTAGTSAIEYGFIASMISIAAMVGVQSLGAEVTNTYTDLAQEMRDAVP
jgi:pilus assembly protein Flp/PilA